MQRQNIQSLGAILKQVLKEQHLDTKLYEMQLIDAWYKTLGSTVKKYTTNIYVNDKKLFVKLNSSVLKNDLMMSRSALVSALNNKIGVTVINEIIFI
ncbi:MAG TPA: DUF721 domain-containing protein [Paludibacteraceae bacterium]|jgi:predicted nucleic acid-binding Zn ribbon protein|nr:DUF721 domain-containing protein [Paludibacteraceae bacterium]HPH62342.1 DUF721 domain-containing protein [Paludibacteraceae bacterium]